MTGTFSRRASRAAASSLMIAVVASMLAGCLVTTGGPRQGRRYSERTPACHPSQHWDGQQCRHNGRGHGARKHDD